MRPRIRLPGHLQLDIDFFGRRYPAWLERWTRRVWTIAGEASFSARLIITYKPGRRDRNHAEKLKKRLWNWGYRLVKLKERKETCPKETAKSNPSKPANSTPS